MDESREELVRRARGEINGVLAIVSEIEKIAQSKAFNAAIEARLLEIKNRLYRLKESLG
jgi:hypothetical protein